VTLSVKVLVQLQSKLTNMYANGTVLNRTIAGGLPEDCTADLMFGQIMGMTMDRTFHHVAEKIRQSNRLLKRGSLEDSLHQLPSLIMGEIVIDIPVFEQSSPSRVPPA
jgi:hypothetical protein